MGFANAYPPLHSAEHLLTALLCRRFPGLRDYSSRLKSRKCVFEFSYDGPITAADITAIAAELAAIVARDLPTTTEIVSRAEAGELPNLHQVPADAETVRIVRLGDADARACIGQHVARTGEIVNFRIPTWREEAPGRWRLNFVVD